MRNYPAFPRATPHRWAGSPRVPHPSATVSPEGAPFDLHALGTPPALILSQDQTLHQNSSPARGNPQRRTLSASPCASSHLILHEAPTLQLRARTARAAWTRRSSIFGRPTRPHPSAPQSPGALRLRPRQPTCQGARFRFTRKRNPHLRAAQSTMYPKRMSRIDSEQFLGHRMTSESYETGAAWAPVAQELNSTTHPRAMLVARFGRRISGSDQNGVLRSGIASHQIAIADDLAALVGNGPMNGGREAFLGVFDLEFRS